MISANDKIEIAADKEILLTSGGAYIRLTGGNIFIHAPGTVEHKAAQHPFMGPAQIPYPMPEFSREAICINCLKEAAKKGSYMMSLANSDTTTEPELPYFPVRNYTSKSWEQSLQGSYGWRRKTTVNGVRVWGRAHAGSDIYTANGEPVRAIKDGTIIASETLNAPQSGWGGAGVITVDHGDIIVRYGEVDNIVATSGIVTRGQQIAKVKCTTWTNQPMLHLEIYTKAATGALSQNSGQTVTTRPNGNIFPTIRRNDGVDPTSYLDNWVNNLPPPL